MVNWLDPTDKVTPHLTVREACGLPSWGVLHQPSLDEQANLTKMCGVLEQIRALFAAPLAVHCMIRPNRVNCPGSPHHGRDYNQMVGGVPGSAHIVGLACDFDVAGRTCDAVRATLLPLLDHLNIRMENLPGSGWVHVDFKSPAASGGRRYFIP